MGDMIGDGDRHQAQDEAAGDRRDVGARSLSHYGNKLAEHIIDRVEQSDEGEKTNRAAEPQRLSLGKLENRPYRGVGRRIENAKVPVGTLDITFYRDDLSTLGPKPVVQEKEIGFEIEDKNIVLVDDVLFTGRTTRAALDALFSHGRPRQVQLCVLIDRGHRELPVEASFVGRNVQTTMNEVIEVKLTEIDDAEKVLLMEK